MQWKRDVDWLGDDPLEANSDSVERCCSACVFGADQRANPLTLLESEGSKFGSDSISMMVASDSTTRRVLSTSRSAHPKNLALEGPQIVDLASVRLHRASINR